MVQKIGFIGYQLSYTDSLHLQTVSSQFPGTLWLLGTNAHKSGAGLFYEQVEHIARELGHPVQYVDPQLNDYLYEERAARQYDRILALSDRLVLCWDGIARGAVYAAYCKLMAETPRRFQLARYCYPPITRSEASRLRSTFGNYARRKVL